MVAILSQPQCVNLFLYSQLIEAYIMQGKYSGFVDTKEQNRYSIAGLGTALLGHLSWPKWYTQIY